MNLSGLKPLLYPFLPAPVKKFWRILRSEYLQSHLVESYAQEGEDLILQRLLDNQGQGFYVDVGAHHPKRFSNTYLLYKRGWSGINIDATPGSMRAFGRQRPRDINLEIAVANNPATLTFYIFDDPALNTFDEALAHDRNATTAFRIVDQKRIPTRRLRDILAEYLPADRSIDVLSIDAEGFDFDVLQSNDWEKFRPRYVLVECLELTGWQSAADPVYQWMGEMEYIPVAKTVNTTIFQDVRPRRLQRHIP